MVDIKREDITLSDWTKGISADEFAGGSYFYAEGIQTGYNTKGFKLGPKLSTQILNSRSEGYAVAIGHDISGYGLTVFTHDGALETDGNFNGGSESTGDSNGGGALIAFNFTSGRWVNGIVKGTKAYGIRKGYIDIVDGDGLFNPGADLLSNPTFADGGDDWTIGTGWTITNDGAEHTTGETGTLETSFTTDGNRVRVAIKIKDRTAGYVSVDAGVSHTFSGNGWFALQNGTTSGTYTLTITPSSDFDGVIEAVNMQQYDDSKINYGGATITTADKHPAIIWGGDLYVGSGNKLDIVNLDDLGVITKSLVDENETIVEISQQAGNLIIRATDGYNSKQYYWNGVDSVATECIEWKGLLIKGVTNTETVCYVLTTSGATTGSIVGYQYRLYAVNGYQRSLLACKTYYPNSDNNLNKPQYNVQKKFDFNDVEDGRSMCMFLDSLYLPGCDGIYKYGNEIPGMRNAWSKPTKYPAGATNVVLGQNGFYFSMAHTLNGVNYISDVIEQRYVSQGYLVTESIYWDKLSTRKALEKLKIGYKNVASEDGNIKIYAIVDDDYFWRFTVSGVSTRPKVGDVYTVAHQTKAEVIDIDKSNKIITFRTIENLGSYYGQSNSSLTKVSGDGDASITTTGYDNMCLIKTIESDYQGFGADLVFSKDFVNNYIPYWYKIQLVVELNSKDAKLSPEIYEISIRSDITDIVL